MTTVRGPRGFLVAPFTRQLLHALVEAALQKLDLFLELIDVLFEVDQLLLKSQDITLD